MSFLGGQKESVPNFTLLLPKSLKLQTLGHFNNNNFLYFSHTWYVPYSRQNGIRDACSTVDIFNVWSSGLLVVKLWSTSGLLVAY